MSDPAVQHLFDDPDVELRWRRRIRAGRASVPRSAALAPHRSTYASSVDGTAQIYAWDRTSHAHWRITDRPTGVLDAAITVDGDEIWWFADSDGDEFGRWMRTPFPIAGELPDRADHPAAAALPSVPDGYNAGLRLGARTVVAALGTDTGTTLWLARHGSPAEIIHHHPDAAGLVDLPADEDLVVLSYAAHRGVSQGVRVLSAPDGTVVHDLVDRGSTLTPMGLRPGREQPVQVLVGHERRGRSGLLLWELDSGSELELSVDLEGDVSGHWFPDGTAILLVHNYAARTTLHRLDLASGRLDSIPTPTGTIDEIRLRPDDVVEYAWSSAASPWQVRRAPGRPSTPVAADEGPLLGPGEDVPPALPVADHWVPGPGGPIHVLAVRPAEAQGLLPTVFRLHGGPHVADTDSWHAMRAAWVDAGWQVIQINYRGSAGYGAAWREAIVGRPGLTELEDVVAVQQWAVQSGLADPGSCIAEGYSWGGMLALLAVSLHPDLWAGAIGGLPVADAAATYEAQMDPLKAGDRALYGGTPAEVPEAYHQASPSSYVEQVRAPVLLLAGRYDPRCPIDQVEAYAAALTRAGASCRLLVWDIGHGPQSAVLVEAFVLAVISFARAAIAGRSLPS